MDERDAIIRNKLGAVKDNAADLSRFQTEAEALLSAARKEVAELVTAAKAKTQAECDAKLAEAKGRVEAELAEAIKACCPGSQGSAAAALFW